MSKKHSSRNAKYRLDLDLSFDPAAGPSTPVRVDLDFGRCLKRIGCRDLIDPHTLVVKRRAGRRNRTYPVQFSDMLYIGNEGWVAWLVDQPQEGGEWWMEFKLRAEDGRLANAPYRPMVGVGDEIYLNGGKWHPLDTPGYHPAVNAVDWTGDGLIDLVGSSHHSNSYGMPWQGFYFWRNIGSNRRPRYAAPMRIHAVGENGQMDFFDDWYTHYDTCDWFGSGRLDLITVSRESGIRIYRNTGRPDATGLPRLRHALTMKRPDCLAPGTYTNVRAVDWDGSGRPSLLLGTSFSDKTRHMAVEQVVLMRNVGRSGRQWQFESKPLGVEHKSQPTGMIRPTGFWAGGDVGAYADYWGYANFIGGRATNTELFDIDGDGRLELLCGHPKQLDGPVYEVWRNTGTIDDPVMCYEGILPWSQSYTMIACRFVENDAFNGCLWSGILSGTGIHYFKRVKKDYLDPDSYVDTGPLLGQGCKLKIEGYGRPSPVTSVRQKGFSLICGDEPGFITLARGNRVGHRSSFELPDKLTDRKGEILRLHRESIVPDNDGERNCGQLKPVVCDWDQDGIPDLIVGGNTRHIFWLEKVDLNKNTYDGLHRITVKGVFNPFSSRMGPTVADLFNRGKPDLLAVDSERRISLFRQEKGARVRTELQPGIPLCYEDGEEITTGSIGPERAAAPHVCLAVCDWRQTGVHDLLISSTRQTFLLENVGSNRAPAYKRPEPFREPDGTVIEISEHEMHVAPFDWDEDGRPDLIIGGEAGTFYLFHRDFVGGIRHAVRPGRVGPCLPTGR